MDFGPYDVEFARGTLFYDATGREPDRTAVFDHKDRVWRSLGDGRWTRGRLLRFRIHYWGDDQMLKAGPFSDQPRAVFSRSHEYDTR